MSDPFARTRYRVAQATFSVMVLNSNNRVIGLLCRRLDDVLPPRLDAISINHGDADAFALQSVGRFQSFIQRYTRADDRCLVSRILPQHFRAAEGELLVIVIDDWCLWPRRPQEMNPAVLRHLLKQLLCAHCV